MPQSVIAKKKKGPHVMAKKKPASRHDSRPEAVMGRLLKVWVEDQSAPPARLQTWLCGYDLPPLGSAEDDEPFLWLLGGCSEYEKGRNALADAVTLLLTKRVPPPEPDQKSTYWYNLLMLAQGLRMPKRLRPVLREFAQNTRLDGSYRGIPLRQVSLAAAGLPLEKPEKGVPNHPFVVPDPAKSDPCFGFLSMLDSGNCTSRVLRTWLAGKLPFTNTAPYPGEQPYVRLIGCIPLGGKHYPRKVALAKAASRVAHLLHGRQEQFSLHIVVSVVAAVNDDRVGA